MKFLEIDTEKWQFVRRNEDIVSDGCQKIQIALKLSKLWVGSISYMLYFSRIFDVFKKWQLIIKCTSASTCIKPQKSPLKIFYLMIFSAQKKSSFIFLLFSSRMMNILANGMTDVPQIFVYNNFHLMIITEKKRF